MLPNETDQGTHGLWIIGKRFGRCVRLCSHACGELAKKIVFGAKRGYGLAACLLAWEQVTRREVK